MGKLWFDDENVELVKNSDELDSQKINSSGALQLAISDCRWGTTKFIWVCWFEREDKAIPRAGSIATRDREENGSDKKRNIQGIQSKWKIWPAIDKANGIDYG